MRSFGFEVCRNNRMSHSVETALLKVQNDILTSMDEGNIVIIVLLDLSAAFDTVDHPVLIDRLCGVGMGGIALDWFRSYLSSRSQSVHVRGNSSPPVNLKFSVPQGSVLGPHLFNVYTLPLQHVIREHDVKFHMYADDLQLYCSCPPTQEGLDLCIKRIQACICDIRDWMSDSFFEVEQ